MPSPDLELAQIVEEALVPVDHLWAGPAPHPWKHKARAFTCCGLFVDNTKGRCLAILSPSVTCPRCREIGQANAM